MLRSLPVGSMDLRSAVKRFDVYFMNNSILTHLIRIFRQVCSTGLDLKVRT